MTEDKLNEINKIRNEMDRVFRLIRIIKSTSVFGKIFYKKKFVISKCSYHNNAEEILKLDELSYLCNFLEEKYRKLEIEFCNFGKCTTNE